MHFNNAKFLNALIDSVHTIAATRQVSDWYSSFNLSSRIFINFALIACALQKYANFPFIDNTPEFAPLHPYIQVRLLVRSISCYSIFGCSIFALSPVTTRILARKSRKMFVAILMLLRKPRTIRTRFREYSPLITKIAIMAQFFCGTFLESRRKVFRESLPRGIVKRCFSSCT